MMMMTTMTMTTTTTTTTMMMVVVVHYDSACKVFLHRWQHALATNANADLREHFKLA